MVDIRDDLHTLGDPVWDTLTYFWVLPSFFPGTCPSQQDNTQRLGGGEYAYLILFVVSVTIRNWDDAKMT